LKFTASMLELSHTRLTRVSKSSKCGLEEEEKRGLLSSQIPAPDDDFTHFSPFSPAAVVVHDFDGHHPPGGGREGARRPRRQQLGRFVVARPFVVVVVTFSQAPRRRRHPLLLEQQEPLQLGPRLEREVFAVSPLPDAIVRGKQGFKRRLAPHSRGCESSRRRQIKCVYRPKEAPSSSPKSPTWPLRVDFQPFPRKGSTRARAQRTSTASFCCGRNEFFLWLR